MLFIKPAPGSCLGFLELLVLTIAIWIQCPFATSLKVLFSASFPRSLCLLHAAQNFITS